MKALKELKELSGFINKKNYIQYNTDWQLTRVFIYAYDYNKTYRVKISEPVNWDLVYEPVESMFLLLDNLNNKKFTGNEAREKVLEHIEMHGELIKLILNHNLECGATAKTYNSVYPNSIPSFDIQLAKEVSFKDIEFPQLCQIKYDGVRILIIKNYLGTNFYTRKGLKVYLPKLEKLLNDVDIPEFVLDTEVTINEGKLIDRSNISGMINSAMHGGTIDEEALVFNVFDHLHIAEWLTKKCPRSYIDRYAQAKCIVEKINLPMSKLAYTDLGSYEEPHKFNFKLAENKKINNLSELHTYYANILNQGYEGLILKKLYDKYVFKRTKEWIKLKAINTIDLTCIDVVPGEGKYYGQIGSLVCEGFTNDNQYIKVKVGSGLSDVDRELDPSHYIGKTIEVKYNSIVKNKNDKSLSLFLPRFVCIRFDK